MAAPVLAAPLHVYYDASVQTAANGASLTSLVDQSGNARDATKTAGAITYDTAGLNGLPAFSFGAGTYATTAAFTAIAASTPITIFAVAKFATTGTRTLVAAATPTFTVDCGMTGTAWQVNRAASVSGGTQDLLAHAFRFFMAASGGATSVADVDGTIVAGPGAAGSGAPTSWRIGSSSSGFQNFSGKISEIRIYAGTVSSAEITAMESYLSQKWGTGSTQYSQTVAGTVTATATGTGQVGAAAAAASTVTATATAAPALGAAASVSATVLAGGSVALTVTAPASAAATVTFGGSVAPAVLARAAAASTVTAGASSTPSLAERASSASTVTATASTASTVSSPATASATVTASGTSTASAQATASAVGIVTATGTGVQHTPKPPSDHLRPARFAPNLRPAPRAPNMRRTARVY